jgi:alkanesulfonate monooxygenase SsuD/methylene tetrahydromethanopterin reductase-like flavin-dependent oxidoreductase (luciferase family)
MLEIAIMIEGQNGLTWPRWQNIARLVEEVGFAGLFRSDHFTNSNPPEMESLELWTSLTWLASHTRRIEFGDAIFIPSSGAYRTNGLRRGRSLEWAVDPWTWCRLESA